MRAGRPLAWIATLALLAASLIVRIHARGDYIPGWDVMGAAQGVLLVSTHTAAQIARWYRDNVWNPAVFWNLYALPCVLVPGLLAVHWPWLFWNHAVVFAVGVVVLWLVATTFRLGRDAWFVLLAWTTSSAVVSQSIAGLPYLTCMLPHALAVCAVLRLRSRPLATAVVAALVYVAATQTQELARTVFLVFLAAVVAAPGGWTTRFVWLLAGVGLAVDAIVHPTTNGAFFADVGRPGVGEVLGALGGIAARLFVRPWIDLPVLVGTGIVSLVLVRRERWFWRMLFAAQVALAVVLALKRDVTGVWPRRFLLVELYALLPVVALFAEWRTSGTRTRALTVLVGVLFLGAAWQLGDAIAFARRPHPAAGWGFPLPFSQSTVDYQTTYQDADWTRAMVAEVRAGKKVILAYNLSSYMENATNPSAIPERLLLSLGPERYADSVYLFGTATRWNDISGRPPSQIASFVAGIRDPSEYVGWFALHPSDVGTGAPQVERQEQVDALLDALRRRFDLVWEPVPNPTPFYVLRRFTLVPRDDADRPPDPE